MQPLPTLPVDISAPASSVAPAARSSAAGKESFSQHLATETDRNALVDSKTPASEARTTGDTPSTEELKSHSSEQTAADSALTKSVKSEQPEPATDVLTDNPGPDQATTSVPFPAALPPGLEKKDDLHPGKNNFLEKVGSRAQQSPIITLLENVSAQQGKPGIEQNSFNPGMQKGLTVAQSVNLQAKRSGQAELSEKLLLNPAGNEKRSEDNSALENRPATASSQVKGLFIGAQDRQPTDIANGSPIVVEQWKAKFTQSPTSAQQATANNTGLPEETILKTENGQLVTVYTSSELEEGSTTNPVGGRSSLVDGSPTRRDSNSNYIHSSLPNNAAKQIAGNIEQQPGSNMEHQADPDNTANLKEFGLEQRVGGEKGAPPFTLEIQPAVTVSQPSTTVTPGTGLMRMPSGILVPEQAVMDQVIQHLTGNRKLESGSIRLQLHPRELGELRLEIEVKQDNVKAHITAQNPQAQEALDRHLPRLREALAEQGLQLSEVEINVSAGDQYEGHRFQENEERHQLGKSYRSTVAAPVAASTVEEEALPGTTVDVQQSLSVTV